MDLDRLLRPQSLAVIGGGAWCEAVIRSAESFGFPGRIYSVHPTKPEVAGCASVPRIADIEGPIDAAFIGVNRNLTLDAVRDLRAAGAGGAVCFAAGFSEAVAEDRTAGDLQLKLIHESGPMPLLGPNCYGFVNALDHVAVWPDQHGMAHVERGVAVLTQSSNIAINLTMQRRGLPIAYMITCGNQAQTSQASLAQAVLSDDRVTCLGVHIEGFGDVRDWFDLAQEAERLDKRIVALKVGRSDEARQATVSHTASLAGAAEGATALLKRLGIIEVHDLTTFLETLKLLHVAGDVAIPTLSSISCSGGEACLVADMAKDLPLTFPAPTPEQKQALTKALGPMVALANPLDYNTYVWRDTETMTAAWSAMSGDHVGITLSIVDYPWTDARDWVCATEAALGTRAATQRPFAVVATLPELMPLEVAGQLMAGGVVPFFGLREALEACAAVANRPVLQPEPPLDATPVACQSQTMTEAEAKAELAQAGLSIPRNVVLDCDALGLGTELHAPLALKSIGPAHKTEAGGVRLNVMPNDLARTARDMPGDRFLVEEMVCDPVAELLVGVFRDPPHGFVLTIAAGGILTEVINDRASLLVPASATAIDEALQSLRIWPLLCGYRGKPGADIQALIEAICALQTYVTLQAETLEEIEINPMIVTPTRAVAADALIRKAIA